MNASVPLGFTLSLRLFLGKRKPPSTLLRRSFSTFKMSSDDDSFRLYKPMNQREVRRFIDLNADETGDLWLTAKKVGGQLEHYHQATSLTFAIQDGPEAGQTVAHVHIHIIPRKTGDFEKNDEIYDALDEKEKELSQKLDLDKDRKDRSVEEMAQEADEYRKLFQ